MFPPISSPDSPGEPGRGFYAPLGAASPLWLLYAGAASAGVAYWWMTRWPMMAVNLEASLATDLPVPEPAPEPPALLDEAPVELVPATALVEELAPVEEPAATLDLEPEPAPEPPVKAAKTKTTPADQAPLAD